MATNRTGSVPHTSRPNLQQSRCRPPGSLARRRRRPTSPVIRFALAVKRIDPIDALRVVLRTNNALTIVDICFTPMTGKT
jgi:hypothetical protein